MRYLQTALIIVLSITLGSCKLFPEPTLLAKIKSEGELVVLTRYSATTYYQEADGIPTGFEYELVKRFADYLGVELKIIFPNTFADIIPMIERGEAHIAAAGLTITEARKQHIRFGPSYQRITQQLVYRYGNSPPEEIKDILEGDIEVVSGSSHAERLTELLTNYPELTWRENPKLESEELLTFVWDQMIDYTIADSNEVAVSQRFYPELRVGFDISEPQPLAWAFQQNNDDSLYNEVVQFFAQQLNSGELDQLIERYYGHTETFDYVGTRIFLTHYYERLPQYRDDFIAAGVHNNIDWRLLAAMGYQESHWNHKAVSPTGVRGLMMLTLTTARQLGIRNRIDPKQSIIGGARYLRSLLDRIPERIQEPDRTWMAVASYNVGLGHLEDARVITEKMGYDPDKWVYVKEHLPLLRQKQWYKKTRYGYARGNEPVVYVRNIRNYFDLIRRITEQEISEMTPEPPRRRENIPNLPSAI